MTADPTRGDNDRQETWHIYFSDVRISTIGARGGVPTTADEWGWDVGFYPGMEPRARRSGSAAEQKFCSIRLASSANSKDKEYVC